MLDVAAQPREETSLGQMPRVVVLADAADDGGLAAALCVDRRAPYLTVGSEGAPPQCDVLVVRCERLAGAALDLALQQKAEHGARYLVVVYGHGSARAARRATDRGVGGLVEAHEADAALAATITAVLAGQTVVPSQRGAVGLGRSLSFREKQILALVLRGYTNKQIGARLYLAESTVKSHLSSSFSKLGVHSRSEAIEQILDPHETLGIEVRRVIEQFDDLPVTLAG